MKKVTSPWFVLAIQNNPAAVPGEFMRQPEPPPLAPDKTAIKAAWASGQPVPGTRLVTGTRLAECGIRGTVARSSYSATLHTGYLLRLIYTSRTTVPFAAAEVEALLTASRKSNYANGITGVLSFSHGHFLQVLEGPENEVLWLYSRILRDTRHRECVILALQLIRTRLFPNWSMGHVRPNPKVGSRYNELLDYRTVTDDPVAAKRLLDDLFEIVTD